MSDSKDRPESKKDNALLNPDDSSKILLDQMRRTYSDPAMPAVTDEDAAAAFEKEKVDAARQRGDTIPPWSSDEVRRQQIKAWNAMAEEMINVVKTIKLNERKSEERDQQRRLIAMIVVAAALLAILMNWWQGERMLRQARGHQDRVERVLEAQTEKHNALLNAIAELAEAQALGIDAVASFDPAKDKVAKAQALEAQKVALEAKRATESDPARLAETERRLEKVDKAADKAAKEAEEAAPLE